MKLNQELIKRLAEGEIVYQHTGTTEDYVSIVGQAFPYEYAIFGENRKFFVQSYLTKGEHYTYDTIELMHQFGNYKELPIYTTEQFYEQTMDDETRELAKRLFEELITDAELDLIKAMSVAINLAELVMKRLNDKS